MLKNTVAVSRSNLLDALAGGPLDSNVVVISILDDITSKLEVDWNNHSFHLHTLVFNDIQEKQEGLQEFTTAMAQETASLVNRLIAEGVEYVVCHCTMGFCRSPAMAAAISKHYLGNDDKYFSCNKPNMLVYRLMLNALQNLEE